MAKQTLFEMECPHWVLHWGWLTQCEMVSLHSGLPMDLLILYDLDLRWLFLMAFPRLALPMGLLI